MKEIFDEIVKHLGNKTNLKFIYYFDSGCFIQYRCGQPRAFLLSFYYKDRKYSGGAECHINNGIRSAGDVVFYFSGCCYLVSLNDPNCLKFLEETINGFSNSI